MVYTYTPTYYTSLHDSITSICKNIIPFSFKKRRLPAIEAAEERLSKQQSDYLKWQQESFHQILKLIGLCKEGILAEIEVSAFRTHLLDTLIASPNDYEQPIILKDKLVFLQELLYAKCISDDEYHSSKRPLLQRLAVQGVEIEARDVIVGTKKEMSNEEWSVVDLRENQCFSRQMTSNCKSKEDSCVKKIKGAASVFEFVSPSKNGKLKEKDVLNTDNNIFQPNEKNVGRTGIRRGNELTLSVENPFWNSPPNEHDFESKSILMMESSPASCTAEKKPSDSGKKKPFKKWGFDGFKKWKKNESKDESAPLSLTERSDSSLYKGQLVNNPVGKGQDTKQLKPILHPTGSQSDFFVDKVLEDNIKKEFTRIETELDAKTANIQLSYDHENSRAMVKENKNNFKSWAMFDDEEENSHPNLFAPHQDHYSYSTKQTSLSASKNVRTSFNRSSIDNGFKYNPFFDV